MDRPIIVLGAGGHAKVVIDTLLKQGANIIGLVDSEPNKIGTQILGVEIIGDDDTILHYSKDEIYLANGIGSVASTHLRKNIFMKFKNQGYRFPVITHPSAIISANVDIQEGTQIMAGAVIQTGVIIGANVIVNTRSSIDHDSIIQSHVHVSPGVTICGGVSVGEGTHVGTGSTIVQGIEIGKNVVIGAASLVLKNVRENAVIYGSPAKDVRI